MNLSENPTGSYTQEDVCPRAMKLGEFRENKSHSNYDHGLRIWPEHHPRQDACKDILPGDNDAIEALYSDFTSWKNGRNGVMGGKLGACVFRDLTLADNELAGFEVEEDDNAVDNMGYLDGAIIIGKTAGNDDDFTAAPHGVITGRTER